MKKLENRYEKMSQPVRAAFWFTVCSFLQRGISMLTTPIFTRILSTEEYGLFSTYLSWETVLLMLVTLSAHKAIMNLYIKFEDQEKVLSAICGLEFTLLFIWMIIGAVFRESFAKLLGLSPTLIICLFVYFIFQAAFQCWALYKRYVFDYRKLIIVTLLLTAGSSGLSIIMVSFVNATAEIRAVSNTIVTMIVGIFLYISIFNRGKVYFDKKIWLFTLGFCIPLMPHYLSEFILQSSDKIMINYLCGAEDVALYSIAYAAGSLITLVTSAINSTFAPYQYQKIKAGEYELLSKRANQVLLFVGAMLTVIMIFSREIVLIFGGYKYKESVDVIIPICLGVYFNYVFQLFARVQEYYERKITVVLPSIMCAILNIILNFVFIKIYGYKAAAYTTFICYALFCIIHYVFYKKTCRALLDDIKLYDAKGILGISLMVVISGIIIVFINKNLYLKYTILFIVFGMVLYKRKTIIKNVKELMSKT